MTTRLFHILRNILALNLLLVVTFISPKVIGVEVEIVEKLSEQLKNSIVIEVSSSDNYLFTSTHGNEDISRYKSIDNLIQDIRLEHIDLFNEQAWVPVSLNPMVLVNVPVNIPKQVGTKFVQHQLITYQLRSLIDRAWLTGYDTVDQQINTLYQNGVNLARQWGLKFGDDLLEAYHDREGEFYDNSIRNVEFLSDSLGKLPYDVIWPEIHMINGQQVLIPIVYLKPSTIATNIIEGNNLDFGSANLSYTSFIVDGAKINGKREAFLDIADTFRNQNGQFISGSIVINSDNTIENLSGIIQANEISLVADKITNSTLITRHETSSGYFDTAGTISTINSVGDLSITTSSDFINQGASISAQGDIVIDSTGGVQILSLPVEQFEYFENSSWSRLEGSSDIIMSQLSSENISILAGTNIVIEGSVLSAAGTIDLLAGMGIFILDGQTKRNFHETSEYETGGLLGTSESSEEQYQKTEIVKTLLEAGHNLSIKTVLGNIVMRAVDLRSDGIISIDSGGAIEFVLAKETEQYSYSYENEDVATFKVEGEGYVKEVPIYSEINAKGELYINATSGIKIEYGGAASVQDAISELAVSPSFSWMQDALTRQDVNWSAVELQLEEWDYEAQGLTEAGAALVAIAVSAATGGAGTAIVGTGGFWTTVAGAALQSGITTLTTQASIALYSNAGDLGATLEQMGSEESVNSLVRAMVTAGLTAGINHALFNSDILPPDADTHTVLDSVSDQALRGLTSATVNAASNAAINSAYDESGWVGFRDQFGSNLAMHAVNTLGEKAANEIGDWAKNRDNPNFVTGAAKYLAHAGLGCSIGISTSYINTQNPDENESGCWSGAGGAVVGEYVGSIQRKKAEQEIEAWLQDSLDNYDGGQPISQAEYQKRWDDLKAEGIDVARLAAAFGALALGGNVDISAMTGANAAENNAFFVPVIIAMAASAYTLYIGEFNFLAGLEKFGEGSDPLSQAVQGVVEKSVNTLEEHVPEEVQEAFLDVLAGANEVVGEGVEVVITHCNRVPLCNEGVISAQTAWNDLTPEQQNQLKGAVAFLEIIVPAGAAAKVGKLSRIKTENPNIDLPKMQGNLEHPDWQQLSPEDRFNLGGKVEVDQLLGNNKYYETEIDVALTHIPTTNKDGSIRVKNDGELGEQMTVQLMKDKTGRDYKSLQNGSNHGLDHGDIDHTNKTIYMLDTKSTWTGDVNNAGHPSGDPETRLRDWVKKARGGQGSWGNLTDDEIKFANDLKKAIDNGYTIKSYGVKMEVPELKQSNLDTSGNVVPLKVQIWEWN